MSETQDPLCPTACQYAIDVGLPEYSGIMNGFCTMHDGYLEHLPTPTTEGNS